MRPRPHAALAVLAFGVSAYFFQAGGWNQNSRFALTRALVERHTAAIDDFVFHTGDFSVGGGHIYCDKAPGLSVLAVPVWAAVVPFAPDHKVPGRIVHLGAYLATLVTVSLPSAIGVAMLFHVAVGWGAGRRAAAVLAVSYAFATQALPYATLFYSHQLVAALYLLALGLVVDGRGRPEKLTPPRLVLVGAVLGLAVATEYPSAVGAAVIAGYAGLLLGGGRPLVWIAVGALPFLAALGVYHTVVFGGPLTTGYSSTVSPGRSPGLLPGMTLPDPAILPRILLGEERGLLRHAPWLAAGAFGLWRMLRTRPLRAEGIVCAAMIAFYLALNGAQTRTPDDWRGGAGIGARYLVPSVPFYVLAMVGLFAPPLALLRRRPALRWVAGAAFAALIALSAGRMFLGVAVHAEPNKVDDPFRDHLLPLWREDRVSVSTVPFHAGNADPKHAWNLGEKLFGLEGRASLLPLFGFVLLAGGGVVSTMWESTRRERSG